jgi:hypothetical protein
MKAVPVNQATEERRKLLRTLASTAGLVLAGCATTGTSAGGEKAMSKGSPDEAEVTPGEDLMQEHGVLGPRARLAHLRRGCSSD